MFWLTHILVKFNTELMYQSILKNQHENLCSLVKNLILHKENIHLKKLFASCHAIMFFSKKYLSKKGDVSSIWKRDIILISL